MAIRFHLDENVDHDIARGLRRRGVDVTTATDAQLLGAEDAQHIAFAVASQRVIYTNDADFLRLVESGVEHCGIVFCPMNSRTVGEIVRYLCLLHDCLSPEEIAGRVEFA